MEVLLENVAAVIVSLVTKKHEVVLKDPLLQQRSLSWVDCEKGTPAKQIRDVQSRTPSSASHSYTNFQYLCLISYIMFRFSYLFHVYPLQTMKVNFHPLLHAPVELEKSDTIAQRRSSGFNQREVNVAS